MMTHTEIKQLLAHYDYLPPHARREVDAHVAGCAECAGELAARRLAEPQPNAPPLPEPLAPVRAMEPVPPSPIPPAEPQPADAPPPRATFPWQRLLLPVALVALFVGSIWFGLREPGRAPEAPARTPDAPARVPLTPQPIATDDPTRATIFFACDDVAAVYRDYAEIARAFEQENPDVRVELKSFRDLVGDQSLSYVEYMQEIAANADAFCVSDVAPLVEAHLLYNLDSFATRNASFEINDFYAVVLDSARAYNNSLYAIPGRFQPALIRYDPAAFEEAGVPKPQPGWNWDDFLAAAVALTRREGDITRRWGLSDDAGVVFDARFGAAARDPAVLQATKMQNLLAQPALLDVLRWYERLYVEERAAPPPRFFAEGAYVPAYVDPRDIAQGKMAMWADLMYQNARRLGKPAPFPVDAQGGVGPVYINQSWAMAADTLHAAATWRWLSYLSRNPPPDTYSLRLPARRSLVEGSEFWKDLPPDEAEIYRYVLNHLAPPQDWRAAPGRVSAMYSLLRQMVEQRVLLSQGPTPTPPATVSPQAVPTNRPVLTLAAPRERVDYYRLAAAAYMMRERDINVQVNAIENLSESARAESTPLWTRMRQVANRADVIAGPEVVALARSGRAQGAVLDLTARIDALPPGRGFYRAALESLQWNGGTWAAPDRVRLHLIQFNQVMFDQRGVAYPKPGWSWENFRETAIAVTLPSADKVRWWGFQDGVAGDMLLLRMKAGPLVDYGANSPRPLLDQGAVRDAAQWYAALWRGGYITVPEVGVTARVGAPPRGAAMWIGPVGLTELDELREGAIGAAPFPVGAPDDATNPIAIENAFAISATSGMPEQAWDLINFLLGFRLVDDADIQNVSAQPSLFPVTVASPQALEIYQYGLEHARAAAPLRREEYVAQQALIDAVTRLALGERDAEEVLRAAQESAARVITR